MNNTNLFSISQSGSITLGNVSFDDYIRNIVREEIFKLNSITLYDDEVSTRNYSTLNDSRVTYYVFFSDTENSTEILSMKFDGALVDNLSKVYYPSNNSYYQFRQTYALDDEDEAYCEIYKVTSSGSYISTAYFRGIYWSPKQN